MTKRLEEGEEKEKTDKEINRKRMMRQGCKRGREGR
jgi:hypothetical protein